MSRKRVTRSWYETQMSSYMILRVSLLIELKSINIVMIMERYIHFMELVRRLKTSSSARAAETQKTACITDKW